MKLKFKNRRGDISIVLFVLGVLAICGLAILSFILSGTNVLDDSADAGLGVFEDIYSAAEKVYFYKNINYDGFTSGEQEVEALLDDEFIEVNIEGSMLMITGTRKDMQVEYTTPLG